MREAINYQIMKPETTDNLLMITLAICVILSTVILLHAHHQNQGGVVIEFVDVPAWVMEQ